MEGGGWRGVEGGDANWVEDQGMEGGRVEMKGGGCIVGGGYRGMEGGEWRGWRWRVERWKVEGGWVMGGESNGPGQVKHRNSFIWGLDLRL